MLDGKVSIGVGLLLRPDDSTGGKFNFFFLSFARNLLFNDLCLMLPVDIDDTVCLEAGGVNKEDLGTVAGVYTKLALRKFLYN